MKTEKTKFNTKDLATIGVSAALVFIGTFLLRIPSINGYIHLGDGMIILAVLLFGTKRGAIAGALGAGLSDLLAGYAIWVIPTALIKGIFAAIIGLFVYKLLPGKKFAPLVGSIVGGVIHVLLYTVANGLLYKDFSAALASIPGDSIQTFCGVVIGLVLYSAVEKTPAVKNIKESSR